jgi:putative ABC transport system substrate-binding protein
MRRRDFISGIAGSTATWPLGALAQTGGPLRRLGVLQPQRESDRAAQSWISAFQQQLAALGWIEKKTIQIDLRWYAGDLLRLRTYAAEMVALKPDVIFCMSTPTVAALQKATRAIPVVFVNANNPVGSGFVASFAHPGGNITGFVAFEPSMGGKWVQTLHEIDPSLKRIGLVYNPKTHTGQYFNSAEGAARALSITSLRVTFSQPAELEHGIEEFAREPHGGLLVLPDASTRVHRDLIVKVATRHRLPGMYTYRLFITSGGLAYYGTSTLEEFREAAVYVDRILRGEKPADLPVQAPTRFELVINLRAAKTINLTISPMLLARADEVIE